MQLGGLGKCCELPQRGPGQSPKLKTYFTAFWGHRNLIRWH